MVKHNAKTRSARHGDIESEASAQKLQRYVSQLREDIDFIRTIGETTGKSENDLNPAVQFYRRFTQQAAAAVRKVAVDRNVTLDDVLRTALMSGKGAPRRVCDHCTYFGDCTPDLCVKQPDRVVRICAPDAVSACRATLCFDATQLDQYLEEWTLRRTGPEDPLPNPALVMGISSGVDVKRDDLLPHLDADTERALRWQVDMWKEIGQLPNNTSLDPVEYGFLRSIVLPAIQRRITTYAESSFIGRWWRMTPEMIRKALRIPANILAYLLDHPWVKWLALWVAKILRFIWCLSIFGVDEHRMKEIKARIAEVVSVYYHFPLLKSVVSILVNAVECLMTGNPFTCALVPLKAGWSLHGSVQSTLFGLTTDAVASLGSALGVKMGKSLDVAYMVAGEFSFKDLLSHSWSISGLRELVRSKNDAIITNVYLQPLFREIRTFYEFSMTQIAVATGLWVLRHLPVEWLFQAFDAVAMFCPPLVAQRAALSAAVYSLLDARKRATAHDVVVAMIADGGFVQQLGTFYELIGILGNLVGCGLVPLFRHVPGLQRFAGPEMCCTNSILDDLVAARSVEQTMTATW